MARARRFVVSRRRGSLWAAVAGAALGSALTYWLDPDSGRRRRGEVRNRISRVVRRPTEEDGVLRLEVPGQGERGRTSRKVAIGAGLTLAAYGLVKKRPWSLGAGLASLAFARRAARVNALADESPGEFLILVDDPEGVVYESIEPERSIH